MVPKSAPDDTAPLPRLPLTCAHTITRATTPRPPPGLRGFNWGLLAVTSLALEANTSRLSLAIGAARGCVGLYRVDLDVPLDAALRRGRVGIAWEAHGYHMVKGVAMAGVDRVLSCAMDGSVLCHRYACTVSTCPCTSPMSVHESLVCMRLTIPYDSLR